MYQYDPKDISMIFAGINIQGFADGTFVNVERNEDQFSLAVGAQGEGTRIKNNNRSGRITITLQQSSPSNAELDALATADELSNSGFGPVLVRDNGGQDLHKGEVAWIVKKPAAAYAKELSNREWIIETDNLQTFIRGSSAL